MWNNFESFDLDENEMNNDTQKERMKKDVEMSRAEEIFRKTEGDNIIQ